MLSGETDKPGLDQTPLVPGSYEDIMVAAVAEFEALLKKYESTASEASVPGDRTNAPAKSEEEAPKSSAEALAGPDRKTSPLVTATTRPVLTRVSAWKRLASERYHNRMAEQPEHADNTSIATAVVRKGRLAASAMWKKSGASERVANTLTISTEAATGVWKTVKEWIGAVAIGSRQPTVAKPLQEAQAGREPDELAGPEDYPFYARLLSRHVCNRLPKGIFWANGGAKGYMAGRDFMKRLMGPGTHLRPEDIDRCLQALHKLCDSSELRGGLNLEKLGSGPNRNHWSIRASDELRVILAVEGEAEAWMRFAPVYIGHHDDAYNWSRHRNYCTDLDGDAMRPLAQQGGTIDVDSRGVRKLSDMLARMKRQAPSVKIAGTASILECFRISGTGKVAGCSVSRGVIQRDDLVFILRSDAMVHVGSVETIKHEQSHIPAAVSGTQCGIRIKDWDDLEVGDRIKSYEVVEAPMKSDA